MIRIYMARVRDLPDREGLHSRIHLQVGERHEAWSRMRDAQARESMAGMFLLQTALADHGIDPAGITVLRELSGRPYLIGTEADFSISHSEGVAVCAVDFGADAVRLRLGVDVETQNGERNVSSMLRIARRWFSAGELQMLEATPTEDVFLQIWTGKEAVIKRSGEGLCAARGTDITQLAQAEKLTVYRTERELLTLCHDSTRTPPQTVMWVT